MAVAGPQLDCRWGELDLVLERQQQLLVVEVKGRRTGHRDRHGLNAFHSAKRRRMARAISCWRAVHPKEDALQSWQKLGGIRVQVLRAYDLI